MQYKEFYGEGLSDRTVRSIHTICRKALEKAVGENLWEGSYSPKLANGINEYTATEQSVAVMLLGGVKITTH